jgi:serine/threonine protein kinase
MKKIDLRQTTARDIESAQQEAKLLSKLKHPNIVAYRDSFQTNGYLYIVMLYCEGGDLYTKIKEQNNRYLDEMQVVEWFVQIAMALQVTNAFSLFLIFLSVFIICCFFLDSVSSTCTNVTYFIVTLRHKIFF